MHEMGIIAGVLDATVQSATEAGATSVLGVTLRIGEMTEAIPEALEFAFEALTEGTICEGAELKVNMIEPRSLCPECGNEFTHDRFHRVCPTCGNALTELIAGREMQLDSIEVDIPDETDVTDE